MGPPGAEEEDNAEGEEKGGGERGRSHEGGAIRVVDETHITRGTVKDEGRRCHRRRTENFSESVLCETSFVIVIAIQRSQSRAAGLYGLSASRGYRPIHDNIARQN